MCKFLLCISTLFSLLALCAPQANARSVQQSLWYAAPSTVPQSATNSQQQFFHSQQQHPKFAQHSSSQVAHQPTVRHFITQPQPQYWYHHTQPTQWPDHLPTTLVDENNQKGSVNNDYDVRPTIESYPSYNEKPLQRPQNVRRPPLRPYLEQPPVPQGPPQSPPLRPYLEKPLQRPKNEQPQVRHHVERPPRPPLRPYLEQPPVPQGPPQAADNRFQTSTSRRQNFLPPISNKENDQNLRDSMLNNDYDLHPTNEPLTPRPNRYRAHNRLNNRRRGRRRFRTTTTTTTTTTTPPPDAEYYDNYYDDDYYDYISTTTTTTTTRRPRRRGGRRRSNFLRQSHATSPMTTPSTISSKMTTTTTTTTTPSTTTKKLSPGYKHRSDGRIIDYMADPNFPYELRGADLTNYPFYIALPEDIDFSCDGRHDGYYANIEHKCQVRVFHAKI
ncbi:uncharacterized protein B4U79_15179 [Dinothrombium tinctorium]|uniref:Uncharacterized protein n=1 Tax=Dinothrombium tinctorium TaxID=1965070 RepID=A0A443R7D7_9ACAR|nr:uncharacterized protein B4U79_15179 [Dinothrombium tinctorium]